MIELVINKPLLGSKMFNWFNHKKAHQRTNIRPFVSHRRDAALCYTREHSNGMSLFKREKKRINGKK